MTHGRPATPLPKKLGITDDAVFTVINPPADFAATLGDVGAAVWQRNLMPPIDVIVAFFSERRQLQAKWPQLTATAEPDGAVWVCWPKRTSGTPSDLTDAVVRTELLPTGWVDNKVCAIDDTWSALRFVLRKEHRRGSRRR